MVAYKEVCATAVVSTKAIKAISIRATSGNAGQAGWLSSATNVQRDTVRTATC